MEIKSYSPQPSGEQETKLSVAFILLPEFTLSALAGLIDTLRLSADDMFQDKQKYCSWTILGADKRAIKSSCGVEIIPWETFRNPGDFDCIVVIGGQVRGHKRINTETLDYLKEADRQHRVLIGVCTGSFALAYAGLLKEYTACIHWFHLPDYLSEFPDHKADSSAIFRIDGNRITCAGGGVSADLAVYIIAKFCGNSIAEKGISGMLMDSPRDLHSVQPHLEATWLYDIQDMSIHRAILLMNQHIREPLSVQVLADFLGISYSTINRLFNKELGVGCSYFYRTFRIAHGFWDVIHTGKSITDISTEFGFADSSHFIKLFSSYYQKSPSSIRKLNEQKLERLLNNLSSDYPHIIAGVLRGELFFSNDGQGRIPEHPYSHT